MTSSQLGKRMDRVEEDVGLLKTEVAKTTASVEGMRGDMSVLFSKLDQVITGTSGMAAAKGMIPWSTVAWAIGLLVSLAGLGVTVTGVAAAVVLWAMDSGDQKLEDKIDSVVQLEDSRHELVNEKFAHLRDDVTENRFMHDDVEDRLRLREANAFTNNDGQSLELRVHDLEVKQARTDEVATKTWDEIVDHEDELDHPIRQTFEGQGRSREIEILKEDVETLRSLILDNALQD